MSAATKEELQAVADKLHAKIDDKHSEHTSSWREVSEQFHELNLNLGRMLTKYDGQEDTNARHAKELESLREWKDEMVVEFAVVKTKQKVAVGIGGKFMMPIIYAMFFASNAIGIFIYLNK
jgi:hypothetical protein